VLDYNAEAETYDISRGGEARAVAAAEAVERLLPRATRTLVDVACGTGIVTMRLGRPDRRVLGVDRSPGMLSRASDRLPGSVLLGDATRLPIGPGSVDAVVLCWLLHLIPDAEPVIAEAARVLRTGGVLITTVDKDAAVFRDGSDIAELMAPLLGEYVADVVDGLGHVTELAAKHGLRPAGRTEFLGAGQGRSPRQWQEAVRSGRVPWGRRATAGEVAGLCDGLAALPDQEAARPDPRYKLLALEG
jgi:ubiquinone/menaquinone biosynthesis C-methylase UbiE